MKVEPLGEKIVVKRLEAEEVTAGGIVAPRFCKGKTTAGQGPRSGRAESCWPAENVPPIK